MLRGNLKKKAWYATVPIFKRLLCCPDVVVDMFKAVIFTQRLTTYRETFAPVGKKSKELPHAMIWHEAISGRWKEDIISTFYMFLNKQRDSKKVDIWLDNCASQNKNWALLCFLVKMVNSDEISAKEIH